MVDTSRTTSSAPSSPVKPRVLIVDDDLDTSAQLSALFVRDGYTCEVATNGLEALQLVGHRTFDLVVSDIRMQGMSGLDLLDRLVAAHPALPVIICTGFSAISGAVDAMRRGAFTYLEKPSDLEALQKLMACAARARLVASSTTNGNETRPVARKRGKPSEDLVVAVAVPVLVGLDPSMLALRRDIESVASSSAPVLVSGESGTGKDLVARAIHLEGPRRDEPFVAVNVSAIPDQLLESELFGHVRGAFTGANEARRGLLVEAHRGTLFLDEIGDMPVGLQAKLLRVLQLGEFRPVGSDATRRVDVRFITATHQDLPRLIAAGRFREDLYFRIGVLPVHVPALRERRGDIVPLAQRFLARARRRNPSSPVLFFGEDAERVLTGASWDGNVRELENVIERLVVFGRESTIHAEDLHFLSPRPPPVAAAGRTLRDVSEQHVAEVLRATSGDKRRAAEVLGIDLSTLYRWQHRKPTN